MQRIALFALAAAALMPFAAPAQQTLVLRDGTQFSGRLTQINGDSVSFQDRDGGMHRFDSHEIDTVRFERRDGDSRREGDAGYARRDNGGNPVNNQYAPQNNSYMTLQAGTQISVRTNENITSRDSNQSRSYSAQVDQDVVDQSGSVVIPRGSDAQLIVRRMNDNSLALDLQAISVNGQRFNVNTSDVIESGNTRQGIGENRRTAEYVGGTAVLGTLLGAIAGGGRGAAIGALAGGATGAGAEVLTRGGQVNVPAETVLSFRLDNPITLNPVRY